MYLGTAVRYCDITGKWQQSNTTECRSTVYADLDTQVCWYYYALLYMHNVMLLMLRHCN